MSNTISDMMSDASIYGAIYIDMLIFKKISIIFDKNT